MLNKKYINQVENLSWEGCFFYFGIIPADLDFNAFT